MNVSIFRPAELGREHLQEWNSLRGKAFDSPFFSPEFTRAVGEARADVRVAVIESDGLAGFFPFQANSLGVGRPVGWRLADFQGPIVRHDARLDVPRLLRASGLVTCHFDHLVSAGDSLAFFQHGTAESPFLDLSEGFHAYREGRQFAGSSAIKQTERKARKLGREVGEPRLELNCSRRDVFESLLGWKREQQRRTGARPVLRTPWVVRLLERIWKTDGAAFEGYLTALYAGPSLVAVHLGPRSGSVLHWWFPTYNSQFERYSPGAILLLKLAEAAAAAGIKRLDLGKGNEPYKRRFMSGAVEVREGSLSRWPLHGAFGRSWHQTRNRLRSSPLRPAVQVTKRLIRRAGHWKNVA